MRLTEKKLAKVPRQMTLKSKFEKWNFREVAIIITPIEFTYGSCWYEEHFLSWLLQLFFFSKGDFKYLPCSMVEGDKKIKHCRLFKNSFHDAVSCLLVNVKIAIESDLLAFWILGDAYLWEKKPNKNLRKNITIKETLTFQVSFPHRVIA